MLLRPAMLSLVSVLVLAADAFAHPGHAVEAADPQSLMHYVAHPDHAMLWIIAAVALFFIGTVLRQKARRLAPAYAPAPKHRR